jgi:hypothetical protein
LQLVHIKGTRNELRVAHACKEECKACLQVQARSMGVTAMSAKLEMSIADGYGREVSGGRRDAADSENQCADLEMQMRHHRRVSLLSEKNNVE